MKSSNKVLLEWTEPGTLRRFGLKRFRRKDWLRLIAVDFAKWFLIIAAFMLLGTLIFHKLNLIQILAYSALCAFPMVAIEIFAMVVNPVHISLRENRIERRGVDGAFQVGYKDIRRCTLWAQVLGAITARGLEISLINGNNLIVEIAPAISDQDIRSILHGRGIEVECSV